VPSQAGHLSPSPPAPIPMQVGHLIIFETALAQGFVVSAIRLCTSAPNSAFPAYTAAVPGIDAGVPIFFLGEATEREKSMMYRTSLRQKMQGVSITIPVASDGTFSGNDLKHSVHVSTT